MRGQIEIAEDKRADVLCAVRVFAVTKQPLLQKQGAVKHIRRSRTVADNQNRFGCYAVVIQPFGTSVPFIDEDIGNKSVSIVTHKLFIDGKHLLKGLRFSVRV